MARTKTDFTNFIDAHPNYFPGQYLLEDDFEIQHQYLSDRQQYHQQSLHVSGIIEGLDVELIQGQKAVNIKSGSAIDSSGNLIVLKKDTVLASFQNITAGELYLQYSQEKQIKQQEDVGDSYTRWQEKPILGFAAASPSNAVKLAKISIAGDTLTLDLSIRTYSGIFLPNAAGNDLTLRSGGNANPNLAILNGSLTVTQNAYLATDSGNVGIGTTNPGDYKLNVQGNQYLSGSLTVVGAISGKIDTSNISTGILDVARIPNLSADKINSGTLNIARIPNLSADKINSGILGVDRIPSLSADKINSGILGVDRIPNLSADKINSGILGVDRIPNLSADKINSGILGVDRIPSLSADKINSGTLNVARIPNLSADKINSGILSVDRIPTLSADKITSGTITGNLKITGAITPSVGNTETTGIMFPKDPGGGGGDAAWMRYYVRSGTTESCTLEIGISNDTDDTLSLVGLNIDLSGHVQLKEHVTTNMAFLQARDDTSNRDISLRIRTQAKGNSTPKVIDALTIDQNGNLQVLGEIQGKVWFSDEYTWTAGKSPVKMGDSKKCVAFLTYVQGKFAGGGEQVYVSIKDDGYWYLAGSQGGAGADIMAKARCIGVPF